MLSALYSLAIAVIVMFALPFSQLRTTDVRIECCCPDPTKCHCPDHEKDTGHESTIKACHKSAAIAVSPAVAAFIAVSTPVLATPSPTVELVLYELAQPHESPSLDRPRGPS